MTSMLAAASVAPPISNNLDRDSDKVTSPILTSAIPIELIDYMGGDLRTCEAARVSTKGRNSAARQAQGDALSKRDEGLIRTLIEGKHGAPTRHTTATFWIMLPIFVARELRTHWVHNSQAYLDMSFSEESGRYKELEPIFWVPWHDRVLIEEPGFKPMKARHGIRPPTPDEYERQINRMWRGYSTDWDVYQEALADNVSREVARCNLPVGIYTSCYLTANLQALLNLIALRTYDPDALFISYPGPEIEEVALGIEQFVSSEIAAFTHEVFVSKGRYGI